MQIGFIKFGSQVLQKLNSTLSIDCFNPYFKMVHSGTSKNFFINFGEFSSSSLSLYISFMATSSEKS